MACRSLAFIAICLLSGLAAGSAKGDTVVMRNGDRLSGSVQHMAAGTLTLRTSYAGDIQLLWDAVKCISTAKPITLVVQGRPATEAGTLTCSKDGYATLRSGPRSAAVQSIPLAGVVFLNPTPAESGSGVEYKGHVTVSASSVRGNSTGTTINGQAAFKARARTYRYALHTNVNEATLGGQTITSNWLVSAHLDRFLIDRKHFRYIRTSVQRDRFRDIHLRAAVGAGYGWQLLDTDATHINVRGGLDLVAVNHYTSGNQRYPAFGWGVHFSHWFWQHRLKLFHSEDGYWDLTHSGEVTLRTRTGLRVPIIQQLLATAQLDVDWDRHPAPGVKPTDATLMFGLGYQW